MKKLLVLILCLFVHFNSFSQIDISKNPYVFLTEVQAKAVAKELVRKDALEQINVILNNSVQNYRLKEALYKKTLSKKDSIISNKDAIIALKDKIINAKKPVEFHSYVGVRSYNISITDPTFYYRIQLEFKAINIGGMANFQPVISNSNTDGFYYNLYVEFKLF